jgi:hypothetical protein
MVLEDEEMGIGVKVKEVPKIEGWGEDLESTVDQAIEYLDGYHARQVDQGRAQSGSYKYVIKRATSEEFGPRVYEKEEDPEFDWG